MEWIWWLGAALILAIVETLSADLTLLMLAGGALGGMVASLLGAPLWLQVIGAAGVASLLLLAVRPALKRRMSASAPRMRTNADAIVGSSGRALTAVDALGGRVRLGGAEWSARLAEGHGPGARLEPGAAITVISIDGATAVVAPAD
ncbi:NfeD family protein [Actinomyces marmotae]|uniref:NfeD family protein n=1 Tax=Actinomyces marmotae TaxID=2737173 RepID=A0A6M8B8Q7_9ACTO|nr:NfeD family protein [Actinomyces marmotae]QKD79613.1 NfeD family protein [Actinomyces marmotae]